MNGQPTNSTSLMDSLERGEWVFDLIEPKFRESLLSVHPHPEWDTTRLCLWHYRKLLLSNSQESIQFKGIGGADEKIWEAALLLMGRKCTLGFIDSQWLTVLDSAFAIIENCDCNARKALSYMRYIVALETDAFRSASHPHYFGVLFLKKSNDPQALAVSIIHEVAHQELFLINLTDRLITEGEDWTLVHAPYQGKPRPPIGRLHSAHALFRMAQFEERAGLPEFLKHKDLLGRTVQSFAKSETTQFGARLVNEVY